MKQLKPNIALRYLDKYQKQLQKLVESGRFQTLTAKKRKQWIAKIKRLKQQLSRFVHFKQVRKVVAGATLILSLAVGNNATAQNFTAIQTNPFGLAAGYYVSFPDAVDLDNDGDLDLVVGDALGTLQYYENTGSATNPSFTLSANNPFAAVSGYYFAIPSLVDIDNDGDFDLVVTEYYNNVRYYENTGTSANPIFGTAQVNVFNIDASVGVYFTKLTFADMDNDGDMDIIAGGYDSSISYQENIGTAANPNFAAPIISPFGINTLTSYYAVPTVTDIDNDGDLDMMIGTYYGEMLYYENTGTATTPVFAASQSNPFNLNLLSQNVYSVYPIFVDLDNDGDMDFLAGAYGSTSGDLLFSENTSIFIPNNPPSSAAVAVDINQDETLGFSSSDFPFTDVDAGDLLDKIRITSLPTNGQIAIAGFPASVNQDIDISLFPQMTYTPNASYFGTDDFQFEVSDGEDFSATSYSFTININGLPTTASTSLTTQENTDYIFDIANFIFNDIDGGNFDSLKIVSLPTKGEIKFNGNTVIADQNFATADFANLTYSPVPNETGFPYTDFQFAVGDGMGFSQPETATVTVDFPDATERNLAFANIQLSPNPVKDVATLQVQTENPTSAIFSIQNLAGQVMTTEVLEINENFTKKIDVSQFTKGIYIVRLQTTDGNNWTEKLLIE